MSVSAKIKNNAYIPDDALWAENQKGYWLQKERLLHELQKDLEKEFGIENFRNKDALFGAATEIVGSSPEKLHGFYKAIEDVFKD